MYATAVGLVMNSTKVKRINEKETTENDNQQNNNTESENQLKTEERSTIFERFTQSLKTFLDNAE
jgi:cell division ATPase FtsA